MSGSETYNINLFSELNENTSLDLFFLTNLPEFAARVSKIGLVTRVIPWGTEGIGTKKQLIRTFFTLPIIIPRYLYAIRSMEKKKRFDLICLQSMTEKLFLTPILKNLGYPIIWTELGPLYATKMSKLITFFYKVMSAKVDKIVAISEDTKKDLINGGVRNNKVVAIYIGIDTNKFKPLQKTEVSKLRETFHISAKATVIGFLGTVTNEKGIEEFVEISYELFKRNKNFHFVVIGNGPSLTWAQDTVKKLKMTNHYTFFGFIEDVTKHLGIMDILFLPTHHYEGLSLALLEAQTMGKVVITSSMGGNPEIVTNRENGFLYKKFNKTYMVTLIDSLAAHRSQLVEVGMRARENALEKFNIQKQAKKFVNLFQNYEHRS